jgi:RNA polymerase-binding transcription factor DksA
VVPLQGALDGKGNVQVQCFEVSNGEFDHFENVSDALTRLDQGDYGRCECCLRRIEPAVLVETPWATLCLECRDRESEP